MLWGVVVSGYKRQQRGVYRVLKVAVPTISDHIQRIHQNFIHVHSYFIHISCIFHSYFVHIYVDLVDIFVIFI